MHELARIALAGSAIPTGLLVSAPGGSIARASYDSGANVAYVTVVACGVTRTSGPLPGCPVGDPVFGSDGTAYQITRDAAVDRSYLTIVGWDGATMTTEMTGDVDASIVVGPTGIAYVTGADRRDAGRGSHTPTTYLAAYTPDGILRGSASAPGKRAYPVIADIDGTAYLTTQSLDPVKRCYKTHLTSLSGDGTRCSTRTFPGGPAQLLLRADGAAIQTTYDEAATTTLVTIVESDGELRVVPLPGEPVAAPVLGSAGTLLVTTSSFSADGGYRSTAWMLDEDGGTNAVELASGFAWGAWAVGPTGIAYQTSIDIENDVSHLCVLHPDGAVISSAAIPGEPCGPPVVASDGAGYLVTVHTDSRGATATTYVAAVDPDGRTRVSSPLPGRPDPGTAHVLSDGSVYQATVAFMCGVPRIFATLIGPDGACHTAVLPGSTALGGLVDTRDVVYQVTADEDHTYVSAVHRDGIAPAHPIPGRPATSVPLVSPAGAVYQATFTVDSGTGDHQTLVAEIASDGSLRVSAPMPGYASNGTAFGANGLVYQSTSVATYVMDPTPWRLYRPPERQRGTCEHLQQASRQRRRSRWRSERHVTHK